MVARTAKIKEPLYQVTEMNYSDFLNFSNGIIINKNKADERSLNWLKVKWFQYRKQDPTKIYIKERLSCELFNSLPIKKVITRKEVLRITDRIPALYTQSLPNKKTKLKTLLKLCSSLVIQSMYHNFAK